MSSVLSVIKIINVAWAVLGQHLTANSFIVQLKTFLYRTKKKGKIFYFPCGLGFSKYKVLELEIP